MIRRFYHLHALVTRRRPRSPCHSESRRSGPGTPRPLPPWPQSRLPRTAHHALSVSLASTGPNAACEIAWRAQRTSSPRLTLFVQLSYKPLGTQSITVYCACYPGDRRTARWILGHFLTPKFLNNANLTRCPYPPKLASTGPKNLPGCPPAAPRSLAPSFL